MKLIDLDGQFNRRVAKYLAKHAGERTEEEWEDAIAAAYRKFADTPMEEIGTTPRLYFAGMTNGRLVETLKEYLLQDVTVPDILLEELEKRGAVPETLALLRETDESLVLYAVHFIGADPQAAPRYAQMLAEDAYDEHVKDEVAEKLAEMADAVTDELLALAGGPARAYALELLSRTARRDERVLRALVDAFLSADEADLPQYAGYLAAYGDERALPALLQRIEEKIGFAAYRELKFAIEALGGSYDEARDFSQDAAYKKVAEAAEAGAETDIFSPQKK